MVEVLTMSKDSEFRDFIYNQTILQESGDFDMSLDKIEKYSSKLKKHSKSVSKIKNISSKIKILNSDIETTIFFPKAENLFNNIKNKKFDVAGKNTSEFIEPVVVLKDVYNDDYSSPGYRLENGELVFDRNVTEEDAWQNDVYVVGPEEFSDIEDGGDDPYAGGDGSGTVSSDYRTDGRAEYGATIQVPSINAIEHWTAGKLEMRVVIINSSGVVIKDREYPKRARSNFKDSKWYSYNDFYYNWYKSNIGDWTIEQWFEVDGGNSNQVTVTIPLEDGSGVINVTIPSSNRDDDCGKSIVQFQDKIGQVYPISHMNFKRD